MKPEDLEKIYAALALKIDELGEKQSELFLAKLVLLLSHRNGRVDEVTRCIDAAAESLTD